MFAGQARCAFEWDRAEWLINRCRTAGCRMQGEAVVPNQFDGGVNGIDETESFFRRPRQPIKIGRSSENLKTSFTRFAAPKQSFDRRQLGKPPSLGKAK